MKPLVFPDYSHSVLNVTTSILQHYNAPIKAPTIPLLDQELGKQYRNVVLILIDAMGSFVFDRLPIDKNPLLRDKRADLTSVYPPTTVSATTSVLTGKAPVESGWIAWAQYFKEKEKNIILFTNTDYYDENNKFESDFSEKTLPNETIYSQIEKASPDVHTHEIFPAFRIPENDTLSKWFASVKKATENPGRNFIYAYWNEFDSLCHDKGPSSMEATEMFAEINQAYDEFIKGLPDDSLVIVIADHGQLDITPIHLSNYPDLQETFLHAPSLESRSAAFFIKPGMEKKFEERFRDHFRFTHILYKAEDFLKQGFLGNGSVHPRIREFLGDYIAVSTTEQTLMFDESAIAFKGHHAGMTMDEMVVPLIIHSTK